MSLTLYGARGSGSAAIEMALRAAALDWRAVDAAPWDPASNHDELRRVNPLGQIPTLVLDDGTVLTESAAILLHLGLAHPSTGLLPEAPSERAIAIRGLVFIAANCYAAVSVGDYPERWTTATTRPAQARVRAAARARLHRAWEIFADTFAGVPSMAPSSPGALAFLAVVVSQWSGTRAHLQANRPRFLRQLIELEAHPRLAPVLAVHRAA